MRLGFARYIVNLANRAVDGAAVNVAEASAALRLHLVNALVLEVEKVRSVSEG